MKEPFNVGDKVITDYISDQKNVVRIVTHITKSYNHESGYCVSVKCEPCKCCGYQYPPIIQVDSKWFKKISSSDDK